MRGWSSHHNRIRVVGQSEFPFILTSGSNLRGERTNSRIRFSIPYGSGDTVEIRARGISATGVYGPFTVTVTITVVPQSSYSTTLGDTTRENLIAGGSMENPATWTLDAGWAVAGGVATHTTGAADAISQPFETTAGKYYRLGYTVSGTTAGSLTPRLTGGSDRPGTAIIADGTYSDRIQAVSGNDMLDDVVAYLETSGCLTQGTHYIWIEPKNADGLSGPLEGSFEITII